jgi:hypothetical protein
MSTYQQCRNFALAWLSLHKIPVSDTATSMKIARRLKCWDGKGGAKGAKSAVVRWHDKALATNKNPAASESGDKFYSTQAWRSLRYEALKRSGGCCELCGAIPDRHALHVDHIRPRSKHPHLALELTNLQVLCRDCNLGKSNTDSIDWRRKSANDGSAAFPEYSDESIGAILKAL